MTFLWIVVTAVVSLLVGGLGGAVINDHFAEKKERRANERSDVEWRREQRSNVYPDLVTYLWSIRRVVAAARSGPNSAQAVYEDENLDDDQPFDLLKRLSTSASDKALREFRELDLQHRQLWNELEAIKLVNDVGSSTGPDEKAIHTSARAERDRLVQKLDPAIQALIDRVRVELDADAPKH